ncbi:Uroporphyrinogen decarboxylase in heme biosynthesis [Irineochytrium annulatum]|nr:Uroporphyrinogen decarboxylase in heme biosynthesis [Irineochytrium annulatum]
MTTTIDTPHAGQVRSVTDANDGHPSGSSPARKRSRVPVGGDFPPLTNDLSLRAARGLPVERVPFWIMRQAGDTSPSSVRPGSGTTSSRSAELPSWRARSRCNIDRYAGLLDASIIFSDILVIPQAMGLEVQMLEKVGPHFPEPLREPEDITRLTFPVDVDEALGYVYEAISLTRRELRDRVPLFGFVGAPWTLMAYMIEDGGSKTLSKAKSWLFKHEKESHRLLQMITDVTVDFLIGQVRAGAQSSTLRGGELSPSDFATFSLPYLSQIATRVKKGIAALDIPASEHGVPMIVFARGANHAVQALSHLDYDVVSVDFCITPQNAKAAAGGRVTLQGNADRACYMQRRRKSEA